MFEFSITFFIRIFLLIPAIYMVFISWKMGFFKNPMFFYAVATSTSFSVALLAFIFNDREVHFLREVCRKILAKTDEKKEINLPDEYVSPDIMELSKAVEEYLKEKFVKTSPKTSK
jgi:hypothetical protein